MNTIAYTPNAVCRHLHRQSPRPSQSAVIRIGLVLAFAAISSMWEAWISPAVAKTLVAATRSTDISPR